MIKKSYAEEVALEAQVRVHLTANWLFAGAAAFFQAASMLSFQFTIDLNLQPRPPLLATILTCSIFLMGVATLVRGLMGLKACREIQDEREEFVYATAAQFRCVAAGFVLMSIPGIVQYIFFC